MSIFWLTIYSCHATRPHWMHFDFLGLFVLQLIQNVLQTILDLGVLMLVLGFFEYKHWVSVNWTVAENQSSAIMTHVANEIATVTQHLNHEISIDVGVLFVCIWGGIYFTKTATPTRLQSQILRLVSVSYAVTIY